MSDHHTEPPKDAIPKDPAQHEPMHRGRHFHPQGEHHANPVLKQAAADAQNHRWPTRIGWFAALLALIACLAVGYREYRRLDALDDRYTQWQTVAADRRALQREDQLRQQIALWQALSEQRLQTARALLTVIERTPAGTPERDALEAEMRQLRDAQEAMVKAATN